MSWQFWAGLVLLLLSPFGFQLASRLAAFERRLSALPCALTELLSQLVDYLHPIVIAQLTAKPTATAPKNNANQLVQNSNVAQSVQNSDVAQSALVGDDGCDLLSRANGWVKITLDNDELDWPEYLD